MKIIRPFSVTDASLVSSNVNAADPNALGAWSATATYAAGDIVQVDSPSFAFAANNSLFTALNHGFSNGELVQLSSTGALPGGLSVGTPYYLVQCTINTFRLSLTKNGAPIITTNTGTGIHTATVSSHYLYESLAANNLNNVPHKTFATSTTAVPGVSFWWLRLGATNRWKAFDSYISSQTENSGSISYVIQAAGRIDSVALMNIQNANSVTLAAVDTTGAVVYTKTYNLISSLSISSYSAWFFEPIEHDINLVDTDFPPYSNLQVTVTLNGNVGDMVRCGAVVLGLSKQIGDTQFGAKLGIVDYSVKATDEFGNKTITQRNYSDIGNFAVFIDRLSVDATKAELTKWRGVPIIYIGSDNYKSSIIYGFFKDFSITISYPTFSVCTIDVEGLS